MSATALARVSRARAMYVALAIVTIAIGLAVHMGGIVPGAIAKDVLGDALWAMMIVWWLSAVFPSTALPTRGGAAYLVCVAVELSQRLHHPMLDAARSTLPGRLILGSGFDPRDLVAYAAGVLVAVTLDWWVVRNAVIGPARV